MTLKECLEQLDTINIQWPDGFNFKNKSKFIGISVDGASIPRELLNSTEWGFEFESHDKEWNAEMDKLMGDL